MSFVGITSLLVSCIAAAFAFPHRDRDRYFLGFLLLVLHLGTTIFYYQYVLSHDADTALYYYDLMGVGNGPSEYGTILLIKLVQNSRSALGGSYLEYFLLFQTFGFVGIIILSRTLSYVQTQAQLPNSRAFIWFLFLPSVHFWTSAIGKDAPLFLACSLATWATLKFSSRWIWFLAAVTIMMLFRPHIAFIAAAALALALFLDNRYESTPRLFFLLVALASIPFLLRTVADTFRFDTSDPNSIADFIIAQHNIGNIVGGTTSVHGGFPFRLFSLMFRPFFVDSPGAFGLVTSVENALFALSLFYFIARFKVIRKLFNLPIFSKFCFFFTIILTISLAAVYYNVGLGLRERVMCYPTLLPIFAAAWSVSRGRIKRLSAVGHGFAEPPHLQRGREPTSMNLPSLPHPPVSGE